MIRRSFIFAHRWLGVLACLMYVTWFLSGIGMMYWDFPGVTASDRLAHAAPLNDSDIMVSLAEAYVLAGGTQPLTSARLNTFDGRSVYRFRVGRKETIVYADTGERQNAASPDMMLRVAAAWAKRSPRDAAVTPVDDVDQWTLEGALRTLRPLWKFSWPTGEQVYVSQASGEVMQFTTTASRVHAYLGPIPHWFYFTPLRKHGPQWSKAVIWSSALAVAAAILGLVLGTWSYSPSKRYRLSGQAAAVPYQGQKRWHMILGLVFGAAAATWAFSGMLSMDPFPLPRATPAEERADARIARALRGQMQLDVFPLSRQHTALAQFENQNVKELEYVSVAADPAYIATLADGTTRVVPLDRSAQKEFDRQEIVGAVSTAASDAGGADISVLDRYDMYYEDRRRERPLPVLLVTLHDAAHTRKYIDPATARVVGSYTSHEWVTRWLYHGLHSLDFPWLYDYRPAWDIVVIGFMLGGAALSVTALVLAWRVLANRVGAAMSMPR